jgi:hypothetical protein
MLLAAVKDLDPSRPHAEMLLGELSYSSLPLPDILLLHNFLGLKKPMMIPGPILVAQLIRIEMNHTTQRTE